MPRRIESKVSESYLYVHVQSHIILNIQEVEATNG